MTFNVVTTGGRALGIFIIPPLKKGGEGGLEKAIKDRRDIELPIIHKISPDPSLLKRGSRLGHDIFIIPLWRREILSSPRWRRSAYFPPLLYHTIRYRAEDRGEVSKHPAFLTQFAAGDIVHLAWVPGCWL
jgi:hypothetical protein